MSMIRTSAEQALTDRLRRVIDLHFDPDAGSAYWLEQSRRLDVDPRRAIRSIEDLALLGPMDQAALACRPIEDFIPRSLLNKRAEFIAAETAGTLGRPKFAVHRFDEFESAFVAPFAAAASRVGFPRSENWLFIGPTGPHIIGKAARYCAKALGSGEPFTVDFDPRWAKALVEGSFAQMRYAKHIHTQALRVLDIQRIGVIFSTPAVIEQLGERISTQKRSAIRGLHLGGMPVSRQLYDRLGTQFPQAVILSGYGNTLFGMMPQLGCGADGGIDYYPHGRRLVVRLVDPDVSDEADRIRCVVRVGRRGQVLVHRLDETQFIANMLERDTGIRIEPQASAGDDGFVLDGIRDPQPIVSKTIKPVMGLY